MNKSEIVFKIPGGLGNQLFSYYCAAYVAQRSDLSIGLDFSSVDRSHHTTSIPLLSMHILPSRLHIIKSSLAAKVDDAKLTPLKKLAKRVQTHRNYRNFLPGLDSREHLDEFFDKEFKASIKTLTIDGYFGDFGFYDALEPASRELQVRNPSDHFLKLREEFQASPYAAVHHRLGDFLRLGNSVGVLDKQYYEESFNISREKGIKRFQVFTNDVHSSKTIFHKWGFDVEELKWIDSNVLQDPMENLLLMGSGKALIASNSTFSFWAGKLAGETCSSIFFPSEFRRDGLTQVKSVPSSWTPIESKWDEGIQNT